jgi:hypothetical protein
MSAVTAILALSRQVSHKPRISGHPPSGFQSRDTSAIVVGRQGGGGGASNRLYRHGGCDDYCHHAERCRAGISLLARLQPFMCSTT